MFYVCSIVFVLVNVLSAFAVRSREAPQQQTSPMLNPPQEQETRRRNIIVAATGITIAILFMFLIASFSVGRSLTADQANKNGLTIEITGHQWWWEARYLDAQASNIFSTANEIHIPVGVPVTFSLRAADVIHSFWVPNLSGKKDLIPGKAASIWLQADQPGLYRGQCAEYCGLQHAHMAFWIVAEP
jgi:cytochrome c oxidase subunit 2